MRGMRKSPGGDSGSGAEPQKRASTTRRSVRRRRIRHEVPARRASTSAPLNRGVSLSIRAHSCSMVGDEEAVHRQPHSRGARFAGGHREASARVCPEASARAESYLRPTTTSPTWRSQRNWRSGGPRWNVFVSGASSAASLPRWSARLSRIRRARGSSTERRRRGSYRIACCAPPEGRTRWTLSLLGERLIELKVFETVSKSSVQRTLKKTSSSPGESSASASPRRKMHRS